MNDESVDPSRASLLQCRLDSCLGEPEAEILNALKAADFSQFCELLADAGTGKNGVDPNHSYKEEHCKSLLHVACELELDKFVNVLLQNGAKAAIQNTHLKLAPIHIAAQKGNNVILKLLLDNDADIKVREGHGWTALHIVAKEIGKQGSADEEEDGFMKCLNLLLNHPNIFVDEADFDGQTPLYLAALYESRKTAELLLRHGASHTLKVHRKPVQVFLDEKFPGLLQEVQKDPQTAINNNQLQKNLESALYDVLKKGDITGFKSILHDTKKRQSGTSLKTSLNEIVPDGSCTFLQFACQHGYDTVVDELLKEGVDPNKSSYNDWKPILLAAHHGQYKVLKIFKEYKKFSCFSAIGRHTGETVLHEVLKRDDSSWINTNKEYETQECLKMLMDDSCEAFTSTIDKILNVKDNEGNTPLHYATLLDNDDLVKILLKRGANIGIKNKHGETPVKRILPHTLEEFFNEHCLKTSGSITHKDFLITFNYSFLAPPVKISNTDDDSQCSSHVEDPESEPVGQTPAEALPETESLWYMSQSKRHRYLLKHPVITSFLWLKWQRIRRYFYTNLAIYIIFVTLLTAFILLNYGNFEETTIKSEEKVKNETVSVREGKHDASQYIWYVLTFLTIFLILRELFQIAVSLRRYIFDCENLLELLMIILTCFVLFDHNTSVESKRHFAALVVLLSWTELVLMIGRHPRLSTYITMFTQVSCTFFRFLLWYSVLIVAFAISFFILFHKEGTLKEDTPFQTQESTLLKTVVMLVGELDFADIPFTENFISSLVFVLFLFLIVLVLVNLLNGLAVSDIQAIRDEAEIVSYASRVELISYTESMLLGDPFFFLSNWPPFRWFQRLPSCGSCRLLYQFPTIKKVLISITGSAGILLFYSYLPDKKKTFYPNKSFKNKKEKAVGNLSLSTDIFNSVKSIVLKNASCSDDDDATITVKEMEKRIMLQFMNVMKEVEEMKIAIASLEKKLR